MVRFTEQFCTEISGNVAFQRLLEISGNIIRHHLPIIMPAYSPSSVECAPHITTLPMSIGCEGEVVRFY